MKKYFVFLWVIFIAISCGSNKGGKFEGTWHHSKDAQHFLIIEHLSGNDYLVKEVKKVKPSRFDPLGWDGAINEKYNFSLQDGKLGGGPLNSFSIVYANGNLIYDGEEYLKVNKANNEITNSDREIEDTFSGVWKGHETVYTITLSQDGTYTILYEDSELNTEKTIGHLENGKLKYISKDYQGKDQVHYFIHSSPNCIKDGPYEYYKN